MPPMSTYRHNTTTVLASAGIALAGAGFLIALRRQRAAAAVVVSTRATHSTAKEVPAVNGTESNGLPPTAASSVQKDADATKEACEGCDCGMMEPGPLEGTMHAYERHVIICSGHEDWPKVIEAEESSLAESVFNMCLGAGIIWTKKAAKEAEANKQAIPKNRVKISACSEPSRGPEGTTDVIVYPEGLIYSLPPADMSTLEEFVKVQLTEGQVVSALRPVPVPYEKMVLVCTHMSRDKRCGRAGPQVVEEMGKELAARGVGPDQIALRGSSHFGGHRFAGVLIIYPQGDWYGLVNKKNASAIVDKCVLGTTGMKANWRGNMNNPGTKAETPAKPVAKAAENAPPGLAKVDPKPAIANGVATKTGRDSVDGA